MDDLSIGSQMPEVFWDYGSPSPNTWKKCQGSSVAAGSVGANDQSEIFSKTKIPKELTKIMKPRNIYKIDSESLDKARTIIAKLKTCTTEPESSSSFDLIFERSGNNEELSSSLSDLPVISGKVAEEVKETLPLEFWNDDIFNEPAAESANNRKEPHNNMPQSSTVVKTSTPLRGEQTPKTVSLKRKQLKRRIKLISNETTPIKESDLANQSCRKNDMTSSGNAGDSLDSCAEFLMTFQPRGFHKGQPGPKKHEVVDSHSTSMKNTVTVAHSFTSQNKPSKQLFEKNRHVPPCRGNKNIVKSDNLNMSDDLISQLLMDDSWTVKCTTNAASQPHPETEFDSKVLSQIFMDDSWNCDLVKPMQKHFTPIKSTSASNTAVNTGNLKISGSSTTKKPFSPAATVSGVPNSHSANVSNDIEQSPCQGSKTKLKIDSNHLKLNSSNISTENNFKFKNPSVVSSNTSSSRVSQKCTAAEIEQKRQQALQRKRQRTKK